MFTANCCASSSLQWISSMQHSEKNVIFILMLFFSAGDKPYECKQDGCAKAFTSVNGLKSHTSKHEREQEREKSMNLICVVFFFFLFLPLKENGKARGMKWKKLYL